jgi:RNA polymerase sigma factor (sigma-70 family)
MNASLISLWAVDFGSIVLEASESWSPTGRGSDIGSRSDAELIALVSTGDDHDAFGELVRRYQSPLRAWLRRLANGDAARADDLAQETFLRAYRRLRQFRGDGKFSAWLYRIAFNGFRRAARGFREHLVLDDEVIETLEAPARGGTESRADLDELMKLLTIDQRSALTLCYQQGLTHEEAAAVLNCPLGTVKTHILRAKEKLRRYLSRREQIN